MSKNWINKKLPEFVRDILRDFCLISCKLEKEFAAYDQHGRMNFAFFNYLVGEEMSKGPLWRLKDMAHILSKHERKAPLLAQLIDWSLGYIFHESMKLKEDAYQQEYYRPWFKEIRQKDLMEVEIRGIVDELYQVLKQTSESILREIKRIRFLQFHLRHLFLLYLPYQKDNELLARFLFAQSNLIEKVFKHSHSELLENIYGDDLSMLYFMAARSLRKGGWFKEAKKAVEIGLKISPDHKDGLQEAKIIAKELQKVLS
ncbi:hypothetical protein [Desulfonauticus submarinus]